MRGGISKLLGALAALTVTALAAGATAGPALAAPHPATAAASQTAAPGTYVPLTPPSRIMDTRAGTGAPAPAARATTHLPVAGVGGVPAVGGASAVVLNVAVLSPTTSGYLIASADTASRPATSNLNFAAKATVANQVVVTLGTNGAVAFYNASDATLPMIVDVVGYYRAGSVTAAGAFHPVAPSRVLDTRSNLGARAPAARTAATVPLLGRGGLPTSGVSAVVLTVTAVAPAATGYVTAYASSTRPGTSNLNFSPQRTVAGVVVVPVDSHGAISLYNGSSATLTLLADVAGWFGAGTPTVPGAYVPVAPVRVANTGSGSGTTPPGRSTVSLPISGQHGVPATDAGVAQLTVSTNAPRSSGYLTVYAKGSERPDTSNLNFAPSVTTANSVTGQLGSDGAVSVFNGSLAPAPLVVDLVGYYRSTDVTPPGRVTGLTATPTSSAVTLNWTNPTDADFAGVMIRRAVGATAPSSPTDGVLVADTSGATTYTDEGLPARTQYSYALFAHDSIPNYSAATTVKLTTTRDNNCTTTWTGAVSGNWSTAGNWTTNAVPTASDWACITTSAPNAPVVIDGAVSVLGVNNSGGLQVTGSLALTDPSRASISPGRLSASGSISVRAALNVYAPFAVSGLALHGPGSVEVDAATTVAATTSSCSGSLWLTDAATLTNLSTFSVAAGAAIGVDTDGSQLVNDGTIQLRDGSSLAGSCSTPTAAGFLNATDGTVTVQSGAAAIPGWWRNAGTVTVAGGASLAATGVTEATATGLVNGSGVASLSGRLVAAPGLSSAVVIGVTLSGVEIDGPAPLTVPSTGTVSVAATTGGGCRGSAWLTQGATLSVSGTLSVAAGASVAVDTDGSRLVNHGTVQLRDQSAVSGSCTTQSAAGFANASDGIVNVIGGDATVAGWWSEAGTVNVTVGTTLTLAGRTDLASPAAFQGAGRVHVDGAFVVPAGVTVPMTNLDGTGTLTLTGTSGLGATTASGSYAVGQLSLSLPDLSPACNQTVVAVSGGSASGAWASITSATAATPGAWTSTVTSNTAGATYTC